MGGGVYEEGGSTKGSKLKMKFNLNKLAKLGDAITVSEIAFENLKSLSSKHSSQLVLNTMVFFNSNLLSRR